MRRTFRGFCGALLLAASVGALNVGAAFAQDLDALSSRILDNPGDVSLNLQYAHAAEAAGKPRLALAAYERILINDPGNEEARQGYERVRRIIEPAYTTTRIELGARWDSDPLNVRNGNEATTYFINASMVDERAFGSMRWRTILNGEADYTPDIDLLNYAYAGVQTGPIVFMSPHIAMLPAIGGGIASLDGDLYFTDVNLSLTFEGRGAGFSYWTRARGGWRDYGDTSIAQSGSYAELVAGFVRPHAFFARDSIVVTPQLRYSNIKGSVFDFFTFSEVSPGRFFEYGLNVAYNYQLTDHVLLSAEALGRERQFRDAHRSDTYFAPAASVTFQNVLPCTCDIKARYQHRNNNSDDSFATYDADQVSLSLIARF